MMLAVISGFLAHQNSGVQCNMALPVITTVAKFIASNTARSVGIKSLLSGIRFSGKNGKLKVNLDVSFAEIDAWAKQMNIDTEQLMNKSFGRACFGLRQKFRQVMNSSGGVVGVPKFKSFEQFTNQLREINGRSNIKMGGRLADKKQIVSFKKNGYQIIGWGDHLQEAAIKFQDGAGGSSAERFLNDSGSRHWMHKRGIHDIPRSYQHNPRRVIPEPFGSYVEEHIEEWAKNAYYKELARQMKKVAMEKTK